MVNGCELLINAVTENKPKMLRGLNQNGMWSGTRAQFSLVVDKDGHRRKGSTCPALVLTLKRGKPDALPRARGSDSQDKPTE